MERFRTPEFWLKFIAYALPLGFLLYVLYWNFLPFGYDKTFTIQVGSANDTSGQFHLEPSRDLSERKVASDSTTYRELNGLAFAVFEPKAVLKNAKVTVSVEGDGVSLTPLQLDFNPASIAWDNSWDFSTATPFTATTGKTPNLIGTAFPFDDCMYFDGNSKLELPYSYNQFETNPFSVYTEWKPEDSTSDTQQIIGHYNWELWQNPDSVEFRIGRIDNNLGPTYSLKYPIGISFFNQKHSALFIYSPSATNGYMQFYLDGDFAGRLYLGSHTIWANYNQIKNLSIGKSSHSGSNNFVGCVYRTNILNADSIISSTSTISFQYSGSKLKVPIISNATLPISKLQIIEIDVH